MQFILEAVKTFALRVLHFCLIWAGKAVENAIYQKLFKFHHVAYKIFTNYCLLFLTSIQLHFKSQNSRFIIISHPPPCSPCTRTFKFVTAGHHVYPSSTHFHCNHLLLYRIRSFLVQTIMYMTISKWWRQDLGSVTDLLGILGQCDVSCSSRNLFGLGGDGVEAQAKLPWKSAVGCCECHCRVTPLAKSGGQTWLADAAMHWGRQLDRTPEHSFDLEFSGFGIGMAEMEISEGQDLP